MSTYKENIVKLIDKQILKGKENYGHTLDEFPLRDLDAIINTQEELIDALFYLENLKEALFYIDNLISEICKNPNIIKLSEVKFEKN